MGTQNGHNAPFLESASLRKRKRKEMERIKQIYKISKKGNKKISCHLVPKVEIALPFEGRQAEESRLKARVLLTDQFDHLTGKPTIVYSLNSVLWNV